MQGLIAAPAAYLARIDKKVIFATVGFLIAAIVGVTSMVSAIPVEGRPTREFCKQNGYRNYGLCLNSWARGLGYGYGGEHAQ
jgi:hypothetical protein